MEPSDSNKNHAKTAKVAAQNTNQTVDLFKNIDIKIQTACESFSEGMNKNVELLFDTIKTFQKQQQNSLSDIQELDKISFVQMDFMDTMKKRLSDINDLCEQFLTKSSSLEDLFNNSRRQLNEEQRSLISNLLEVFKEKEHRCQKEMRDNIRILYLYNEQQKLCLDSMRRKMVETFTENYSEAEKFVEKINQNLVSLKQKSLENLKALQEITVNFNMESSFIEKQKKLTEDFRSNMLKLQEKRRELIDANNENMLD